VSGAGQQALCQVIWSYTACKGLYGNAGRDWRCYARSVPAGLVGAGVVSVQQAAARGSGGECVKRSRAGQGLVKWVPHLRRRQSHQ
jgi:hypothetical protein